MVNCWKCFVRFICINNLYVLLLIMIIKYDCCFNNVSGYKFFIDLVKNIVLRIGKFVNNGWINLGIKIYSFN